MLLILLALILNCNAFHQTTLAFTRITTKQISHNINKLVPFVKRIALSANENDEFSESSTLYNRSIVELKEEVIDLNGSVLQQTRQQSLQ